MLKKRCFLVISSQESIFSTHDLLFQKMQSSTPEEYFQWENWPDAPFFRPFRTELNNLIQSRVESIPVFNIPPDQESTRLPFWESVLAELEIDPIIIRDPEDYEMIIRNQASLIDELQDHIQQQVSELKQKTQYHAHEQRNNLLLISHNQRLEHELKTIYHSYIFRVSWWVALPFRLVYDLFYNPKHILQKLETLGNMFFQGIQRPVRLFKSLNRKNFNTLINALREESPKDIFQNFQAFLSEEQKTKNEQAFFASPFLRPRILFIPPNLPEFDQSSGGKRAFRMLELLANDCDVFVFTMGAKPASDQERLEKAGITVIESYDVEEAARELQQADVIIYAWYYTYFSAKGFITAFPKARIIVDTVDVHWVREERSVGHGGRLSKLEIRQNKRKEIESYQAADMIWTVTENDKTAILTELPGAEAEVVSNIHEHILTSFAEAEEKNMLFFGGFQHTPNVLAVQMIVEKILPGVRVRMPGAKLLIAGSKAPAEVIALGMKEGVEYLGFIEEDDISALYQRSMIAVSPLPYGAGIKGKICEAISYMTPVATNAIGNEGIDLEHATEALLSEDMEELANMIVDAMEGKYDLKAMTSTAQKKLEKIVAPANVLAGMKQSLMPQIAICIVTWNQQKLLQQCLESIFKMTRYPNFVIMVHSNGCDDGTQEFLQEWAQTEKRIQPILSPKNEVFVLPNNRMMEMTPETDVVLLNNDTQVTEGWLMGLYRAAYSSERVGIAGSKLLFPDGRLQEFGSELTADGTGRNIGKWDDPDAEAYQNMQSCGYVSGCAMYIKRSTIEKIGTFDEQFHPCYYEDSDFCYTAKEEGLETVVTPWSVVYHLEGATSGTDTSQGFKAYQEINRGKFVAKHQGKQNGILWEALL